MSAKSIKSALGLLQDDPENAEAWLELEREVDGDHGTSPVELAQWLEAARKAHESRRDYDAVGRLLEIEVRVARGTAAEGDLLAELAGVYSEEHLDDTKARSAYERLSLLRPEDGEALDALERAEAKRAKWPELVDRYVQEAAHTADAVFRSSLLVSAAEAIYRFGRDGAKEGESTKRLTELLRQALSLDARNRRAEMLLERVLREGNHWDQLFPALERFATEVTHRDEKIAAWTRLARAFAKKLGSRERAAAAYERVVDLAPGHPEAAHFLASHFTSQGMWEHLVALYEEQLGAGALRGREEEFGATLQIAMVHWRMRGRLDAAEPWFEKARRIEPAHPGMLSFFREWCSASGDTARLATILTEAQRALADGTERTALVAEVARLAEEGANAQKAIEQWRTLLRQDPRNREARDALKRLYRNTAAWNALTDLLRQEIEKVAPDDIPARLVALREIAAVYRDHIKSDSALVTVLTQVVQLAPDDLGAVRELVRAYEALARWRDLLAMQARQAELEPEASVRSELWRTIARRWLDQFSNMQNAVEAYEKLHASEPRDGEAIERLKELYGKRRAYRPLFDLLGEQAEALPSGTGRRELWMEMARLAAERLDLGPRAIVLYKQILEDDPSSAVALDALEKQAEREKDFVTVAEALERRVASTTDSAARSAVLQKLGLVYSDRVGDTAKAMTAWRRLLAVAPGHAKALRVLRDNYLLAGDFDGLAALYSQNGDWEGLVEVLSGAADKTTDPALKVDLSFRSAEIYVERLKMPERAFRAYERVLSVRPVDERAASALVPMYEADEKWGRLPALYEILLGHADGVDDTLKWLDRLVNVCGQRLQDRAGAFGWARKAYELAPDRSSAIDDLERAARAASQWNGFVETIAARLVVLDGTAGGVRSKRKRKREQESGTSPRAEERRALRAKLAETYAREMGRIQEAVEIYRALVEEDDGDEAAVQTLDRLLRESDRQDDLRWLFELRIERANTALKIDLLAEWALLEEEAFASPERAIESYRRMLKVLPHHGGALRALARLLRAQGDAEGAIEVIAIDRDQRDGNERATREIELAKLYLEPLGKYGDAIAACERAFRLSPNDPRAVAVVEQLLSVVETRARAAAILERAYDETNAAKRQAEVLEVLIATSAARDDRLVLYGRMADVLERKLEDSDAAFDVIARAAGEYPTEIGLWDRLTKLSAKTGRAQGLVDALVAVIPPTGETGLPEATELDFAQRIAALYDEKLDDVERARPYLERMLARQPGNEHAFLRLKQILTTHEQWLELAALYERVIGATVDPIRSAELLTEVALVAEEITGDRPRAILYYERILELDPSHEQAIRSLDSLYASEQRWDRLAALIERRLERGKRNSELDLRQRLGTLLFVRLGNAEGALSQLEQVLRARPNAIEAQKLVEQILDTPELRARAAVVLEGVYADRDEVADLVRVLEVHLEFAKSADERRDLLRRVAELRDERLRDDAGALDAYARLLPLDPDDARARQRMLEIARRIGAQERAAGVLVATAAAAAMPLPRADILMDVARLYENQLGDTARAEAGYRQVLQLAPADAAIALPACRALEKIYMRGQNIELRDILRIEVGLEDDPVAKRDLRGRLGALCESVLDDPAGAIEAWRARAADDEVDTEALLALDRLYEGTGAFRELVVILRSLERLSDDAKARRVLLVRIATILAERFGDVNSAIEAYRAVVDEFGADRSSLASLATLYATADRWQDLADTLEADLALADLPSDKIAILARLGDVRQRQLGDVTSAIDAYRQALALDPMRTECRSALEALLVDPAARRSAAEILRPLYESDGFHDRLLRVLDIQAEYAESVGQKLTTIAQAAQVAERPLGDPARAFSYAALGLREAVGEPELPQWIERAERLASVTGQHAELVSLLRAAVGDILDGDLQLEVTLRIADIARSRLGDLALAKDYYARALDLRGNDRRALLALDSLYEETGDNAALLDIVKRRAEVADDDADRKRFLFKQARLCDEKLGDMRAAIAVYEQILEMGPDAQAIDALERLYAKSERWDELVGLYERQVAFVATTSERKAVLHHALGNVLETRVHDVDRAFGEYASALVIDPWHAPTIASLESLMIHRDHASRAAAMLEPVYLGRSDWRRVMATLEARLAVSEDPDERRQLLRRLSKLHEEQEENYAAALETTAQLLEEDLTDESTWAELERLARVANAEPRLASVYARELEKIAADEPATARLAKRAGELFEAQKDIERGLQFYRRAHAFDPESNDGSFEAIDRLLKDAGRPLERVELYRGALDYKNDPEDRLRAIHSIARIQEGELKDESGAIDTYRAALDVDEGDTQALEALCRLYARGERWGDLADLMRRRAEQSALPEEEARFRMELARLLVDRLGDAAAGISELEAVVELAPPSARGIGGEAVETLERLLHTPAHKARVIDLLRPIYERSDDWRHLVALNEERLSITTDDKERIGIWRESAKLWEERGGDTRRAFDAVRAAWTLDPEDGDAREQLERLASDTLRWDDLADAYETAISTTDGLTRRELLSALAHLHDRRRDDPRRALDAWDRLFAMDETEIEPLDEMDALASLLSDWATLVRILTKKAELYGDDELRASTWRRVGEARRDMLDDPDGAIDAYERALELEPNSTLTIDYLLSLHESKRDASRLVDLYRRRVELCGEGEGALRFQLLVDASIRFERDLSNRRDAIECLTQALLVRPGDEDVLRRLDGLYSQERLWPELLDNLRAQVEGATGEAARGLKRRIAALFAVELSDPHSALSAYGDVLQGGYDEESTAAIRSIGESRDDLRADAADLLEPMLRSAGKYADVAAVLEMKLGAEAVPEDRAKTLRSLATTCETELLDLERAQSALIRALGEVPDDPSLHTEIERLASKAGEAGWGRYADALQERAVAIFDAGIAADLFVRLGRVSEDRLGDVARAAKAYAAAVERIGDDGFVLGALDRLFVKLGDTRHLAEVIERRIAIELDPRVQADLLYRLGRIQTMEFGHKAEGLATFRQALERAPDQSESRDALASLLLDDALFEDAFEALEFVYRALGRRADVGALYEKRVLRAQTTGERTRARLDQAQILLDTVGDSSAAQRTVEAAVLEDPSDEEALVRLERLAGANGDWQGAEATLRGALAVGPDLPSATLAELWIRLAEWSRDKLADAGLAESAFLKAQALEPENLEVLRALEDLRRAPGRERDLIETLRSRARLESSVSTKRELLRQARHLADAPVGDPALAEATLRDLVAEDDNDLWALAELTDLRAAAGDHLEVVKLMLRRAELVVEPAAVQALKHEAAAVLEENLHDDVRATMLYEDILDTEPEDSRAATALRGLYGRAGRDVDLARLLLRLIDVAPSQSQRAELRLELARLQADRFQSPDDAIETLRAILDEDGTHARAVLTLSQIYELTGRDVELAELLKSQLESARERADVATELVLLARLGEVQEGRLGDVAAAQETYEQILLRDSEHVPALEAVARIAERRAEWERAATALSKLVDLVPPADGVSAATRLAEACEKRGDPAGAEDALQRGLRLDPSNTNLRASLGARWEKTERWLDLANLLVGDADIVAMSAANSPEPVRAVPLGRVAGGSNPPPPLPAGPAADQVKLLKSAAEIYLTRLNAPDLAIPILERASRLSPHERDILLSLCEAYKGSGRGREAAQVLEKVIASFGNRRTKELAVYHHKLGRARAELGDRDLALAQLDMAFKIDPGSIGVLRDLGVLAFEANDLDRAQKTFRALLLQRLDAASGLSKGDVFFYLGEISGKQGDRAKAVQMYERALENDPGLDRARAKLMEMKG